MQGEANDNYKILIDVQAKSYENPFFYQACMITRGKHTILDVCSEGNAKRIFI